MVCAMQSTSKLYMADLAGSERISRSKVFTALVLTLCIPSC